MAIAKQQAIRISDVGELIILAQLVQVKTTFLK
jgi:hypothetical protein